MQADANWKDFYVQIKIWHHNLLCLVQMLFPGYQL